MDKHRLDECWRIKQHGNFIVLTIYCFMCWLSIFPRYTNMSNNKSDIFSIGKSVVLTGSNWIMFERTFTAYLRIHGLSNYVKPMFVPPPALTELQRAQYAVGIGGTVSPPGASSSGKAAETTVTEQQWDSLESIWTNYEDYFEKDEKIKGYLILAVAPNIQHIVKSQDMSREAMAELRWLYGLQWPLQTFSPPFSGPSLERKVLHCKYPSSCRIFSDLQLII